MAAHAFAIGVDADGDVVVNAQLLRQTLSLFAKYRRGMCFIHHQGGAVLACQFGQFTQRRHVAIHRVERFNHDDDGFARVLFEQFAQML